jgi:hypothetical protein
VIVAMLRIIIIPLSHSCIIRVLESTSEINKSSSAEMPTSWPPSIRGQLHGKDIFGMRTSDKRRISLCAAPCGPTRSSTVSKAFTSRCRIPEAPVCSLRRSRECSPPRSRHCGRAARRSVTLGETVICSSSSGSSQRWSRTPAP